MAPRPIHIQLCGELAVAIAGERVDEHLPGRQGVLLLGYLVLHRARPVEREEIIEALWGDDPPGSAPSSLRALLSKTRAVLGQDVLFGREALTLRLPPGSRIDLEDAAEAIHRAEAAVACGGWAAAWGPARVALLVARRGFMPGAQQEWVENQRKALADWERRALLCIAASGAGLGGTELSLAEQAARSLTQARPLDEPAHRTLIEVLLARDATAEALDTYESLRRRLREELGADPSTATRELHRRLLTLTAPPPDPGAAAAE